MCGINGILNLSGIVGPKDDQQIQLMNNCLAHRGPNDEGVWQQGPVTLGHRRLSIIDLSAAGHQPMSSYDGRYWLTFNGEIYNFQEIRATLTDYPFQSNSDTEVLLAAYAKWGVACLSQLNGMFAFAIWDQEKQELFIARDRLGIKPLYYYQNEHYLIFSSEIRALMSSGHIQRKIDTDSLIDYLRYQTVHGPKTIIQNVQMLPPGHYLLAKGQDIEIKAFWSLLDQRTEVNLPAPEWRKRIFSHLKKAIERRLVADVPFGAFLSGGIDSSAIVALMSQIATEPVKTFSVTFAEEQFSEARYARMVAKKFGTDHHEIQLSPIDFLTNLPAALAAMDHPSGDGPNTFVVSQATKAAGITMALSGLGGDELFAGYPIFKQATWLNKLSLLNSVPQRWREMVGSGLAQLKPTIATAKMAKVLGHKTVGAIDGYPLFRQVLLDEQISRLVNMHPLPANQVSLLMADYKRNEVFQQLPLFSQVSVAEISTYMQQVLLRDTDQMSMAHALEVRVPFLDHELVELVLQIPDTVKYPNSPKQLLVESMGDLLPPEIVNRPKMGFTLPYQEWMRGPLRAFCETRLQQLGQQSLFNAAILEQLWSDFLAERPNVSWSRLWTLVVLSNWMEQNEVTF